MTVNWTPFLTLLPLRLPANDMMERGWTAGWRNDLGDGDRFFVVEQEGNLGRWPFQTPPTPALRCRRPGAARGVHREVD